MRVFFDTNVLVYLFDADSPRKQEQARVLLQQHTETGETLLSTQVLQEFYVAVTRKLARPLEEQQAFQALKDLAALPLVQVDANHVLAAAQRSRKLKISFWDALILESAVQGGASVLYSEDLHEGQELEGVRIKNPFR